MSNQKTMLALIREISGQANVLTIPRVYIRLTGSHRAALLLSQCIYWSDKSLASDGWFWKSYREWEDELALTRKTIDNALKVLAPWVETKVKKANGAPTKHYRVNLDRLGADLEQLLQASDALICPPSICPKGTNPFVPKGQIHLSQRDKSLTETTAEITAETTFAAKAPPERLERDIFLASLRSRVIPSEALLVPDANVPPPSGRKRPVFAAIVEVCGVELTLEGEAPKVGKVERILLAAKPPFTADEVYAWGALQSWRSTAPTVWQLKAEIGSIRSKRNPTNGKVALRETPAEVVLRQFAEKHGIEPANKPKRGTALGVIIDGDSK